MHRDAIDISKSRALLPGCFLSAFAALFLAPGAASAAGFSSSYTHHDYAKCAERPSPEAGVIEVRACEGLAGIPVIWTGEPDSSSVGFGKVMDDDGFGFGPFYEPDKVVEWRGPLVSGTIAPVAAILRYWTGPSVGNLSASRLVVYRIAAGQASCVMGIVKGPDANDAARTLVDRHASRFVCGKSARVTAP